MKKLCALIIALITMCSVGFAEDDFYITTANELAECVGLLTKDENYAKMFVNEEFNALIEMRSVNFSDSTAAYKIVYADIATFAAYLWNVPLSDFALETTTARLPTTIFSLLNSRCGMEQISVASILSYSRTYIMPDDFAPCAIILAFDGANVGVAFSQTGDNTITASAMPVFFSDDIKETLLDIFQETPIFTFEQVR